MQVLEAKAPEVLSVVEELPSLERACSVSTPALLEELTTLRSGLREAQAELQRSAHEPESAAFALAASAFVVRGVTSSPGPALGSTGQGTGAAGHQGAGCALASGADVWCPCSGVGGGGWCLVGKVF
jgi:hypothetical protein